MEKFIPYEKLSKKEKRKLDQAKRQTWGNLNPVTRKPENSKAYNRNKARNWKREISRNPVPGLLLLNAVLLKDQKGIYHLVRFINQFRQLFNGLRNKCFAPFFCCPFST